MRPRRNEWLVPLFVGYLLVVGGMFFTLPRLTQFRLMPWDYWWGFLLFTPTVTTGILGLCVRAGWFSGWAVGLFFLAAVALGLFLGWITFQMAAAV